jgi:hypothetical protein
MIDLNELIYIKFKIEAAGKNEEFQMKPVRLA